MPVDHFNLRSFDLNLLLSFDALMQTRSVTRAAALLRVQQPSMSHALSTLRILLDDPLLQRVGARMEPTLHAQALAPRVREILERSQALLEHREQFDPERERRTFRVGINGQIEALVLPELARRLAAQAPGIRVLTRTTTRQQVFDALDDGGVDLALGYFPGASAQHLHRPLQTITHLCCWHPRQLALRAPLSAREYAQTRHATVSAKNNLQGYMEEVFAASGVELDIVMSSSNFVSLLVAATQAPLLVTLSAPVALQFAPLFGLRTSAVPLPVDGVPLGLFWHMRSDRDPATCWLRDQFHEICAALPSATPAVRRRPAREGRSRATSGA